MEETLFTLTSLIALCMGEWRHNEYSFNDDRSQLTLCMKGYGDSLEYWQFGCWQECDFITQGFYPLEDDDSVEEKDDGVTPMRSHEYKGVYIKWILTLPPNRKRGDTYTVTQIQEMVTGSGEWGDDSPGNGYYYYNCDEDYTG